jgi:hypothetical protein
VFQAALKKAIETRPYLGPTYQTVDFGQPVESLDEWMLTAIAKLIVRHYPVAIERVREAGGPITDVVDSAMERAAESLKEGERLTGEKLENWLALCLDEYLWEYRGRMKTEIENINRSEYEKIRQSLRKETT